MENLINTLLNFLSKELTVMLIAALPVIEMRGAIPVGLALGFSSLKATNLSLIGSIIPVPFILLFIKPIFNYLKKTKLFNKVVNKLTERSLSKSDNIQKYGAWGLFIFVAIPLPGTGVWTGSLIASILNMKFKPAFLAILFGNIVAGILILLISNGVFKIFGL